ncbi:MAG: UDP-N-acetylmuramate:L-alanyl-gamma-D-glutamyl-meso-diaminopimelate ligase [Vicinamibacteria bacterium]|nr:UDP-N-acetylmuramate:L-alanyl-gamma-D-glutamyl-meso-diaminopimelate ligase [Vicinamibacteria bacterium]
MRVHLVGICGKAMASLAGLLRSRGDEVTGSDQNVFPPMSTQVGQLGIRIRSPFAADNVPQDVDRVVIGNFMSRGNPEVEAILDRKLHYVSLPEFLAAEFIRGKTSLVVAGTHGKTTTTSLLAYILAAAGRDPSFLVGGIPRDFGVSFKRGGGDSFVVEGDEYDCAFFDKRPKFVHYLPDVAIIGNIEFDHADIYADLADVQKAFLRLINVVPRRGLIVAGIESPALLELLPRAHSRVATFAVGVEADWRGEDLRAEGERSSFRLIRRGEDLGRFILNMAGEHNLRNALAALAAADDVGVAPEQARAALASFGGVKQRLEIRGRERGITVYDDFAHHPTAVRETLKALRSQPVAGRIVAVFEPRSYTSRTRIFQEEFGQALAVADLVIVAGAHLPARIPESERISETDLISAVRRGGVDAEHLSKVDEIVAHLKAIVQPGDRVVMLSNGSFDGIHDKFLTALRESA